MSDFSLTTFSPSGKLLQIDYAVAAVSNGDLSLGIKAKNGVVIASEKKIRSVLVDADSIDKIVHLSGNVGTCYSGMGPDFRVLCRRARKSAARYQLTYNDPMPVSQLVRETASVMQEFTQSGGVRPFGVSLLMAGYDDSGPQLWQVDPSGSYWAWKASATGKNSTNAKTLLEKRYNNNPDMDLEDAIHNAIIILKEGFEGAIDENNVEIGIIGEDRKFRVLSAGEVRDYIRELL
jgi:20S proteasome subunit alpha 2